MLRSFSQHSGNLYGFRVSLLYRGRVERIISPVALGPDVQLENYIFGFLAQAEIH